MASELPDYPLDDWEAQRYDFGYFPDELPENEHGLVGFGRELTVPLVLEAYAKGIFPWTGELPIPWFSPDPRLILEPHAMKRSRSLRAVLRSGRFTVTFDTRYAGVMEACGAQIREGQDGTWITDNMHDVYGALHRLGYAHSVEVSDPSGALVGGLYGLSLGRAFFGESMFHLTRDASKVALTCLCDALAARDFALIDCQQETAHLTSLGAYVIPRDDFRVRLAAAHDRPTCRGSWADWAPDAARLQQLGDPEISLGRRA